MFGVLQVQIPTCNAVIQRYSLLFLLIHSTGPPKPKEGENTSLPGSRIPGPAVNKRGDGLGKSQQEDVTENRSRAMQQLLMKPICGHTMADSAAQEPGSTLQTFIPQSRKDNWAKPCRAERASHAPVRTAEALSGLQICGFYSGLTEDKQLPRKHCSKYSLGSSARFFSQRMVKC